MLKPTSQKPRDIVVIRLGALGDMVLCFQAFHRIRAAHPSAFITLVTMPAFESFARMMPWFDDVVVDTRPPFRDVRAWYALVKRLEYLKPMRVYDLQGKFRQSILHTLMGGFWGARLSRMEWSGAAWGCSLPRAWPPEPNSHFADFVKAQLDRALIPEATTPIDLAWLDAPIEEFNLTSPYVFLIPGCAAGREYKRWPAPYYAMLANRLADRGITCLAIGTKNESDVIAAIRARAPQVVDMAGRTSLTQLAALARGAMGVVGNDTGPTHLVAAVGAPTLALFSGQVNPVWSSPRGERTAWLQKDILDALSVDEVFLALHQLMDNKASHTNGFVS